MKQKNLRRIVAGISAMTMAAGLTAAIGMSTATAAPDSISWADGGSNFKRTISDTNPAVGDIITVTTNFYRSKTPVEYVEQVRDVHPACLTIVGAKVDGTPRAIESQGADFARVTGSWAVRPLVEPKTRAFEFTYTVGADCALGTPLKTGMTYNGTLGAGNYAEKGPKITVKKADSTTAVAITPTPQAGTKSTLTATVAPSTATGDVEFFDGATSLGTTAVVNGTASIDWTPTIAGQDYSITAAYPGDAKTNPSTSAAQTGTVTAAPTVPAAPTGLAASANPITVGTPVTISGKAEAGSSVTVTAGDKTCTTNANPDTGDFSCEITPTTAGDVAITAIATNGVGPSTASAPVTLTVNPVVVIPAAPTDVTATPGTVTAGEKVTVTGKAEAGSEVKVTGAGSDGCTATADAVTGAFSCEITPTETGLISVTATNSAGAGPEATTNVTVNPAEAGAPVISISPNTPKAGEKVTITVTNTDVGSTVTIKNGNAAVCEKNADDTGTVTCDWTPAEKGTYTLTVEATVDGESTTTDREVVVAAAGTAGDSGSMGGSGSLGSLNSLSSMFSSTQ